MPELIDAEPGSPEWRAARLKGVTATDIVTICGLSATDSAYALYWRKLGVLPDIPDSGRWRLGRDLEPVIHRRLIDAEGMGGTPGGLWRSSERPWQMATPDRLHWDPRDGRAGSEVPDAVIELKSWADAGRWQWDDGPPAAVRAQVLWQMDVMGVASGHVGVLFLPSGEFQSHVIEHESTYAGPEWGCNGDTCMPCAAINDMRRAGNDFREWLVLQQPPSPDGSAASLAALKARYPDARNDKAAPIPGPLFGRWNEALELAGAAKTQAKALEAEIRELIGEAGVIEVDGEVVARRLRYPVKAHTRKASVVDKIQRVKRKDNDDDE